MLVAMPVAVVAAGTAVAVLLLLFFVLRALSQHRTAKRVRQVEESRQAGTLPPDVRNALEQASRRSGGRRPSARRPRA